MSKYALRAASVIVVSLAVWCHLYRLKDVPRGLYVDEASIGYNALTLLESGAEEHGERFPVYFEALGEYKNPLYIYAAAAVFRVLGASEATLRLTSALFFLVALGLFGVLLRRLYPGDAVLQLYGFVALAFVPHYFAISRVSFEAISELPFLVAVLLGAHLLFEEGTGQGSLGGGALLGVTLGLSIYSYSTNRVFSPLMTAVILLVYFRKDRLPAFGALLAAFALLCVPLLLFATSHPGALTRRFSAITYLYDTELSFPGKARMFAQNYWVCFSPGFLFMHGDWLLRHTSGLGVLTWTVAMLAVVGVVALIHDGLSRFLRLVVVLLVLSPVPEALTSAKAGHVLRCLPLSLFAIVLSCRGFDALLHWTRARRQFAAVACLSLLAIETGARTWHYFTVFPGKSVEAFYGSGFPELLQTALATHPNEVEYLDTPSYPIAMAHSYFEFYRRVLQLPRTLMVRASGKTATPGTCVLYYRRGPLVPPGVIESLTIERSDYAIRLKCFE